MANKTLKEQATTLVESAILEYLDKDPDTNIPKLMNWWDKFDRDNFHEKPRKAIRKIIEDPDNVWYRFIRSFWTDIDPEVRKTLFKNLLVQTFLIGNRRQEESRKKYNCNIPWAILMDPTSACNLHCTGCWAAEYGNKLNMDYETLDSIIKQGKELGTYMYIYSAGNRLCGKKTLSVFARRTRNVNFLLLQTAP